MQQQTIETLRQALQESALPFAQQEPLASHTTFQIGGPAVFWCTPKNANQLRRTLALCRANGVRTYLLGNGSNTLFADEGYDGAVIDLRGLNFGPTAEPQPDGSTRLTASAGLTLGRLCAAAQQQGLAGLAFACGIPGTIGGAVYMNAGAYGGEMKDVLENVTFLDSDLTERTLPAAELALGYRTSLFEQHPDAGLYRGRCPDQREALRLCHQPRRRDLRRCRQPDRSGQGHRAAKDRLYAGAGNSRSKIKGGVRMKFVIVTGLSGAGKSMAVNALEDIGFFCIDNIPVALLPRIVDFALQGENQLNRVAVVMDVRGVRSSEQLEQALSDLDARKFEYEILFLDANDAVIQRRYKETRRQHPITISEKLPITEAIARERRLLQPLRARAQYVIDTSLLSTAQNKERVCSLFLDHGESPMALTVVSFGFKYGLPQEADLVLDVRCLPNPFYVPELKNLTGLDEEVVDYVMAAPESQELLRRYESMLEYALPLYVKEGKSQLMIAVGCTGGKHRSITFARKIGEFCEKLGYEPSVQHRDAKRTL